MAMRVGELARRTGVGVSTLRAWERRFHFLVPQRSGAGHRLYEEADVERVNAVLRLVAEGLTLPAAVGRASSVGPGDLSAGAAEALLYHQILEAVGHGIWVIRGGRTRYVNRRMAELMRYSVDELVALSIHEIFEPDDLPLVKARTEQARNGERLHFTQELRRGDGSTFLAEVNTTPLLNQARRYEGAVALVEDITDRHQAQTEARLRATLLDSIGEAVTATTPDGTLAYVNPAAERLFGFRAGEVIGRPSIEVFPTSVESAEQVARLSSVVRNGKRYTGRLSVAKSDGTEFVAQVTTMPARDAAGTHVGFVGVITDQTERDRHDRRQQTQDRQSETVALLGTHLLPRRSEPGGVELVLTEALEATRRLLNADRVAIIDVLGEGDELRVRLASPSMEESVSIPSGSRSFAGYTALARKVVVAENAEHDDRFESFATHPDGAAASAIGAPIFGSQGLKGVFIAESSTLDRFTNRDANFIQGIANLMAFALASP